MDRPRRRQEAAAIDITWVSCRGVRSSLPFHTPCLYASVSVTRPSSAKNNGHGQRRPHRVKTPTDRAGGENPEWDAPLRLYLPDPESTPAPAERELELVEAGKKNRKDRGEGDGGSVLLVRFELKAEVAVLGDVLAASAVVPVPDLVADGRTRRVSYQLAGPDGRQANGVISFSYTFHQQRNDDDHKSRGGAEAELVVAPPTCPTPTVSSPVAQPAPTAAAPRLYPAIEWPLTEEIPIYHTPLPAAGAAAVTLANSRYYPPPPPPSATLFDAEPIAVYPPAPAPETSSCSLYPPLLPASAMYPPPPVDLLPPVSWYPPPSPTTYGVERRYGAEPRWDDRCLYG